MVQFKVDRSRNRAPIATSAALGYAMLRGPSVGVPPDVAQIIAVTSVATMIGVAPRAIAGLRWDIVVSSRRVLSVACAAAVFSAVVPADLVLERLLAARGPAGPGDAARRTDRRSRRRAGRCGAGDRAVQQAVPGVAAGRADRDGPDRDGDGPRRRHPGGRDVAAGVVGAAAGRRAAAADAVRVPAVRVGAEDVPDDGAVDGAEY